MQLPHKNLYTMWDCNSLGITSLKWKRKERRFVNLRQFVDVRSSEHIGISYLTGKRVECKPSAGKTECHLNVGPSVQICISYLTEKRVEWKPSAGKSERHLNARSNEHMGILYLTRKRVECKPSAGKTECHLNVRSNECICILHLVGKRVECKPSVVSEWIGISHSSMLFFFTFSVLRQYYNQTSESYVSYLLE